MTFQHQLLDIPPIVSVDTDNGRYYTTPDGNRYQSVTTFLGKHSDKSWLDEWKARVGEDKAKRVSTQASNRGTAVHNILEQVVLNNPKYALRQMPHNLIMAESMAKVLRENVDVVHGIEIGLWSDKMEIAGRADLLAKWKSTTSIIDFKTAKYTKKEEDILNYFLQCTLYALMVEEITGTPVPQIVVIIGVDFENPQVFIKPTSEYIHLIQKMVA